jgi:hypothetical protein
VSEQALAIFLWALAQVETPHGVPTEVGPFGEEGRWQIVPAVRADRTLELVARGERVTERALAAAHVRWIERTLTREGVDPLPFNIALAWNAGVHQATRGRAPVSAYHFAARVVNLTAYATEQERSLPMNTSAASHEALFSAAEVARELGLEEWAVRLLHPGRFSSPDHWREEGAKLFYTVAGLEVLAAEVEKRGYKTRAHALRVFIAQRRDTPSRALVPPAPKSANTGRFWWQEGSMA